MYVKPGMKTWSEAPQVSSLKSDNTHHMSALQEKQFGNESIGDIANKIADPGYLNRNKLKGAGNDKLGKNAFLKLMLAQMKNQDPTNPMKSYQMAAQLAQFSSLEQLFNINQVLNSMHKAQGPINNFQALTFIGKDVSGDTAQFVRSKGDKRHGFSFQLAEPASSVQVNVRGPTGNVVRSYTLANLKKGNHRIVWNGEDKEGRAAPPGQYTFVVDAKGIGGRPVYVKTDFSGKVTGINYTPQGPVLLIGDQAVKLKDITKIIDPATERDQEAKEKNELDKTKSQAATPGVAATKAMPTAAAKTQVIAPKAAHSDTAATASNLQNVPMASDLQNKISNEIKPAPGQNGSNG